MKIKFYFKNGLKLVCQTYHVIKRAICSQNIHVTHQKVIIYFSMCGNFKEVNYESLPCFLFIRLLGAHKLG